MKKFILSAITLVGMTVASYGSGRYLLEFFEKYGPCLSAVSGAQNALQELGYDEDSPEWVQVSAKVWQNCTNHIDG